MFEDFSKYFEIKNDEIQLKNLKYKKLRKRYPDIGIKNMHIRFKKDRSILHMNIVKNWGN